MPLRSRIIKIHFLTIIGSVWEITTTDKQPFQQCHSLHSEFTPPPPLSTCPSAGNTLRVNSTGPSIVNYMFHSSKAVMKQSWKNVLKRLSQCINAKVECLSDVKILANVWQNYWCLLCCTMFGVDSHSVCAFLLFKGLHYRGWLVFSVAYYLQNYSIFSWIYVALFDLSTFHSTSTWHVILRATYVWFVWLSMHGPIDMDQFFWPIYLAITVRPTTVQSQH